MPEQNGLLEQLKKRKLAKYGHWKRRSEGLVMAVTDADSRSLSRHASPLRTRVVFDLNAGVLPQMSPRVYGGGDINR